MQLSSARVGGLAPARETVTDAALAACVRSWQGGPLYLVCHWDSLSKGWNFGFVAQNSGDRAHFASRKSTTTHFSILDFPGDLDPSSHGVVRGARPDKAAGPVLRYGSLG
jgi:hypothetical protein